MFDKQMTTSYGGEKQLRMKNVIAKLRMKDAAMIT
jgi:hypothetical protein